MNRKHLAAGVAAAAVALAATAAGAAENPSHMSPAAMSTMNGMGTTTGMHGMTGGFYNGSAVSEVYSRKWYCDKTVSAKSDSGCEQGARANVPPPGHYDPEYAIVPIGFTPDNAMTMNCPQHEGCIGHPTTLDMRRAANDLALVMNTTGPALLPTLGNKALPGHNHYLTKTNGGKPEWWNVVVIGCTSPQTYNAIYRHKSFAYIQGLLAAGDPGLLKPAPTNLFIYFSVKPAST